MTHANRDLDTATTIDAAHASPALILQTPKFVEFFIDQNSTTLELPDEAVGEFPFLLVNQFLIGDEKHTRGRVAVDMTNLLGVIDPYYDEIDLDDDDEAFRARYFMARAAADAAQRNLNGRAMDAGHDLTGPESDALWREKNNPPVFGIPWDGPVPLVLVRTDYAPYTDRPTPDGVTWIDPTMESTLLATMHDVGHIVFAAQLDDEDFDFWTDDNDADGREQR